MEIGPGGADEMPPPFTREAAADLVGRSPTFFCLPRDAALDRVPRFGFGMEPPVLAPSWASSFPDRSTPGFERDEYSRTLVLPERVSRPPNPSGSAFATATS